jgi:hypothetical protein
MSRTLFPQKTGQALLIFSGGIICLISYSVSCPEQDNYSIYFNRLAVLLQKSRPQMPSVA